MNLFIILIIIASSEMLKINRVLFYKNNRMMMKDHQRLLFPNPNQDTKKSTIFWVSSPMFKFGKDTSSTMQKKKQKTNERNE